MIGSFLGAIGVISVVTGLALDRLRRERELAETLAEPDPPADRGIVAISKHRVSARIPPLATFRQLLSEKSCPEIPRQHPEPPDPAPDPAPELPGSPEPPPARPPGPGRCLVGIRPDGALTLRGLMPREGWPIAIRRLRAQATLAQRPTTLDSKSVLVRLRGEVLELHAPGRFRLIVTDTHAELAMEARAADLGVEAWLRDELGWAKGLLGVESWSLVQLPLCAEFVGLPFKTAEVANRDRWQGVGKKTKMPNEPGDGEALGTLYIGGPAAGFTLKLYMKSRQLGQRRIEEDTTLTHRWRQQGWDGREPVLRVEVTYREDGLQLRPRGAQGHEGLGFDDPAILTDPEALARLFAHVVGHPDKPQSGRYRFLDEAGEVDPRWQVIQAAAAEAPFERLSEVRARRQAERRERQQQAERRWVQAGGEVARFDGHEPGTNSTAEAREHLSRRAAQMNLAELEQALVRADALHGDLFLDDDEEAPCRDAELVERSWPSKRARWQEPGDVAGGRVGGRSPPHVATRAVEDEPEDR